MHKVISNAAKFTDHGSVTLRTSRVGQGVVIAVEDTGSGIPQDEQATVFERFRQVRDAQAHKPKGTGLGLAICQRIFAGHQGEIMVTSEVGEGSTFTVCLPFPG